MPRVAALDADAERREAAWIASLRKVFDRPRVFMDGAPAGTMRREGRARGIHQADQRCR
jgi:hypothetical protein